MAISSSSVIRDASGDSSGPPAEAVQAELERILDDPGFEASPKRRELLRFVVEEALAGRADRLKGFVIAQAVFDRDDDFDPQSDSVVRVEARRLRRDLDGYYAGAGKHDPVVVSIPKGGYVPHFEVQRAATPAEPSEPATP